MDIDSQDTDTHWGILTDMDTLIGDQNSIEKCKFGITRPRLRGIFSQLSRTYARTRAISNRTAGNAIGIDLSAVGLISIIILNRNSNLLSQILKTIY